MHEINSSKNPTINRNWLSTLKSTCTMKQLPTFAQHTTRDLVLLISTLLRCNSVSSIANIFKTSRDLVLWQLFVNHDQNQFKLTSTDSHPS